jgi:hypothetical protein
MIRGQGWLCNVPALPLSALGCIELDKVDANCLTNDGTRVLLNLAERQSNC